MSAEKIIVTHTGQVVELRNIQVQDICLADIVHSLPMQCRYNGHCDRFYSVAEHCIRASWRAFEEGLSPMLQMAALLHDASETYIGDIVYGVKRLPTLQAEIASLEVMVNTAICGAFKLPKGIFSHPAIKKIDVEMLTLEMSSLFPAALEPTVECYGIPTNVEGKTIRPIGDVEVVREVFRDMVFYCMQEKINEQD